MRRRKGRLQMTGGAMFLPHLAPRRRPLALVVAGMLSATLFSLAQPGGADPTTVATPGPTGVTTSSTPALNTTSTAPPPSAPTTNPPSAAALVPYQFIAKAYTELLGRAPNPSEWTAAVRYFEIRGCTPGALAHYGEQLVATKEYGDDYAPRKTMADDAAIALTLFRFVLNREPDASEFVDTRNELESGVSTASRLAAALFSTTEFTTLTEPAICDPANPSYYFGQPGNWDAYPAIETPESGQPSPDEPEAQLQLALNARSAAGGGTVWLATGVVVGLTTTLVIPGNVTLSTTGNPGPHRYGEMAQLVRLGGFTQLPDYSGLELVRLNPGAKLVHIWVDGQRDTPDPNNFLIFDVRMLGGVGTTVRDDRISNTYGASSLEDDGAGSNVPGAVACSKNVISDNLVEAYASSHTAGADASPDDHPQADGLGVYCTATRVVANDIVDISDTAIVLFTGASFLPVTASQLSYVANNRILSAGNSYSFGIATDPSYSLHGGPIPGGDLPGTVTRSFAQGSRRATITDNVLWSGARTHFDVLLSSGTHDLFGSVTNQNCSIPNTEGQGDCGGGRNATGALWTDNSSDGLLTEIEMGIYIGGTEDAVIDGNRFPDAVEVTGGFCPKAPVVVAGAYAPGLHIDEPVYVDSGLTSDNCVNPKF